MSPSPKTADEIARLMRDPDSMRAEAEQMRRATGRGRHDPNQPRVPAVRFRRSKARIQRPKRCGRPTKRLEKE